MNTLNLKTFDVQDMEEQEIVEINGGFLPIPVMLGIWAVQTGLVAAGIGALATVKAAEMQAQ